MPAYNFKERFAAKVESGVKTQTVRKCRKRPTKKGDTLYLYIGMRTKKCKRLGIGNCTKVVDFEIPESETHFLWNGAPNFKDGWEARVFVESEGFETWEEMIEFFKDIYGLPFEGEVIYWILIEEE